MSAVEIQRTIARFMTSFDEKDWATLRAQLDASGISVAALTGAPVLQGAADVHLSLDGPLARPRRFT